MRISRNRIVSVITGCLLAIPALGYAQEQWERDGEIEDVEIEIVRERQIVLPKASRNFEKVPPRPVEPIEPAISYNFRNLSFSVPDYKANIRPLKLKQEEISKIYGNFISAGFGNFASPYLNAWLNTKRDKSKFFGARIFHRSFGKGPVDGKNSANGNTDIKLFGSAFGKSLTAEGGLNYENTNGYFYGYTPGLETKRDSIRQIYNRFSMGGALSNTRPADFNYLFRADFSYLTDHYNAAESDFSFGFGSSYKINDKSAVKLASNYSMIARKDALIEATPRHLFKILPSYQFSPLENLSITLGARAVLENDTIRSKSIHLYPDIMASFNLTKFIKTYAWLTGDMEKVSLHTLSSENIWINSNINIFHTNKSIELVTGIQGKLGGQLSFDVGLSAANLKDLYFYQNAVADRAKFDLVYDQGNTKRVNFFGEVGLNKNEVVRLSLRGDYYAYSTDQQPEAWHRPTYKFNLNSGFNIYQKVVLNVGFIGQGGMKALDNETAQVVNLDPGIDLNMQATYHLSKQVSAFLKFENMLSNDYPIYFNYPVRGFQVLGGVSWSF